MKFKDYINEGKSFKDLKRRAMDELWRNTGPGEYDKKKVEALNKINDPKKFVKAYMKLSGATEYDLPDDMYKYL